MTMMLRPIKSELNSPLKPSYFSFKICNGCCSLGENLNTSSLRNARRTGLETSSALFGEHYQSIIKSRLKNDSPAWKFLEKVGDTKMTKVNALPENEPVGTRQCHDAFD